MCGSSIIASGFHVGVFTLDDYACVNWKCDKFKSFTFSQHYYDQLISHFGYYKVHNGKQERLKYQYGAPAIIYKDQSLQPTLQKKISQTFNKNIMSVRGIVLSSSAQHTHNLKELELNDPVILGLKLLYPQALSIRLNEKVIIDGIEAPFYEPNESLKKLLTELAGKHNAGNSLALIDPYGNLILARCDRFDLSPINSAIINAVTDYSQFKFGQINVSSANGFEKSTAYNYLPSLHNCTFIFLNALAGDDPISLQTIGAYGFTVQTFHSKGGFIYINGYKPTQTITLESIMINLPKFFCEQIKIQPIQAKLYKK